MRLEVLSISVVACKVMGWMMDGGTYRDAPFSMPAWLPRSLRLSATRFMTVSASLPLASVPRLARCSTAAIRASNVGEIPSTSSGSLP